jgi:hypothetical protein
MDVAFPSKLSFMMQHGFGLYFIVRDGSAEIPKEFADFKVLTRKGIRYIEVTEEVYVSPGPWVNTFFPDGVELHKATLPKAFFYGVNKRKEY